MHFLQLLEITREMRSVSQEEALPVSEVGEPTEINPLNLLAYRRPRRPLQMLPSGNEMILEVMHAATRTFMKNHGMARPPSFCHVVREAASLPAPTKQT